MHPLLPTLCLLSTCTHAPIPAFFLPVPQAVPVWEHSCVNSSAAAEQVFSHIFALQGKDCKSSSLTARLYEMHFFSTACSVPPAPSLNSNAGDSERDWRHTDTHYYLEPSHSCDATWWAAPPLALSASPPQPFHAATGTLLCTVKALHRSPSLSASTHRCNHDWRAKPTACGRLTVTQGCENPSSMNI